VEVINDDPRNIASGHVELIMLGLTTGDRPAVHQGYADEFGVHQSFCMSCHDPSDRGAQLKMAAAQNRWDVFFAKEAPPLVLSLALPFFQEGALAGRAAQAASAAARAEAPAGSEAAGLARNVQWQYGETYGALGTTDKFGNITIRPGLVGKELEETIRHEAVHSFLSPRAGGVVQSLRADIRMLGYRNSHLLRYSEEALAETFATGSLRQGLSFPLQGPYQLSVGRIAAEGGGYMIIVGGSGYAAYKLMSDE